MTDVVLEGWVSALIELARRGGKQGAGQAWTPGTKLKLLLAAYAGARNTGEDVRVEEILRQVQHILGDKNIDLTVVTLSLDLSQGYFGDARQIELPDIFPPFLSRQVSQHDGVVVCLGPTFSNKFSNAITTVMFGLLGIASAQNKLSMAYGVEAGHLDSLLTKMARRYCRDSSVIARNEESQGILSELGVRAELGTDTAWTFEPLSPDDYGRRVFRNNGWDERQPVLALCPINPFWWPVKASLGRHLARLVTGAFEATHYRSLYFHKSGREVRASYERYLTAFSNAVTAFRKQHPVFPVVVGSDKLDRDACVRLAHRLGGAPVFVADQYNMTELVSLLRCSNMMVSSRFHAIVTSMPGLVPSAGVTMDERIRNLMRERGHQHLLLEANDPDLEDKLLAAMNALSLETESIRDDIGRTVVKHLKTMAAMGAYFEAQVRQYYPGFSLRSDLRSWEDYLPPMGFGLRKLLESYGETGEPLRRHRA